MSLKSTIRTLLIATIALAGTALAGNTTTTSTMRITVNVVPTVQMSSSAQETSGAIAFGNDAQLHLRTQPDVQPLEESLVISEQSVDQRASKFAALDSDSRSMLIRKTYIAK
jgi:hypothetical protein